MNDYAIAVLRTYLADFSRIKAHPRVKAYMMFLSQIPVFMDNITQTSITGLSIIPSSQWLIGIEKALASEVGAETILRRKLGELYQSQEETS